MSSSNQNKKMIVNDPIYMVMNFHGTAAQQKILKRIIDSREFQRLRRISQLGLTSYVFPGATHSRFCHSLGTAYLASQIIDHLQLVCSNESSLNDKRFEVILTALLHDIGHGPFSHSFEHVLKVFKKDRNLDFNVLHEEWSLGVINSRKSEVNKILRESDLDIDLISAPLMKDGDIELYLKQIISSQLDADRMDYLRRDAHFAGVSLGSFDVGYLLNCLTVIGHTKDSNIKDEKNTKTLGITSKGVRTFESFALARQLMNRSIYFHPKVKVIEYMVERLIRMLIENKPEFAKYSLYPEYFSVLHEVVCERKKVSNNNSFINNHLDSYLKLTDDTIYALINFLYSQKCGGDVEILCRRIIHRDLYEHYQIVEGKSRLVGKHLENYNYERYVDYDIIKLDSSIYKEKDGEKVFVERTDERVDSITSQSRIISTFSDKSEGDEILIILSEKKSDVENIKLIVKEIDNCVLFTRKDAA